MLKMSKSRLSLYKRKASGSDDNMVPLINIVFLLLIFFMVAGKIQVDHAKNIELPSSGPQADAVVHDINVVLDAEGNIALNDVSVSIEDLASEINSILLSGGTVAVALQADAHLEAKQLTPVLTLLRQSQVKTVHLFTRVRAKS